MTARGSLVRIHVACDVEDVRNRAFDAERTGQGAREERVGRRHDLIHRRATWDCEVSRAERIEEPEMCLTEHVGLDTARREGAVQGVRLPGELRAGRAKDRPRGSWRELWIDMDRERAKRPRREHAFLVVEPATTRATNDIARTEEALRTTKDNAPLEQEKEVRPRARRLAWELLWIEHRRPCNLGGDDPMSMRETEAALEHEAE